jgi:inosine-uridine nucleoside N-ribohydrolase
MSAPEAIIQLARRHRGEIAFAFVGPLTNLAVALSLEPRLVEWVLELVIMGGAFKVPGNSTPHAEFNVYADPEAAAVVARSRLPQTWIGLDVTHQTMLDHSAWAALAEASGREGVLVRETARYTFERRGRPHAYLHDPLAISVVEQPHLVTVETGEVRVDVGEFRRGETRLVQPLGALPTAKVAVGVDKAAFAASFGRLIG